MTRFRSIYKSKIDAKEKFAAFTHMGKRLYEKAPLPGEIGAGNVRKILPNFGQGFPIPRFEGSTGGDAPFLAGGRRGTMEP